MHVCIGIEIAIIRDDNEKKVLSCHLRISHQRFGGVLPTSLSADIGLRSCEPKEKFFFRPVNWHHLATVRTSRQLP